MTSSTVQPESDHPWLEKLVNHPFVSPFIHPLLELLAPYQREPSSQPPEHLITIPEYLLKNQFAVPLEEYSQHGWSEKAKMFIHIAEVTSQVEQEYRVQAPMPSVIPLTHKLWEKWLANGQKFDKETNLALTDLINQIDGAVVVRHLDDDGNNKNVGVHSYPGVPTAAEAIEKIETQYRHFANDALRWQDKGHDVEVCVGIYPHADPPEFKTTMTNGVETLSSGQPPIGIVVSTSQNGQIIQVDVGDGDNLGIQEIPGICDTHYFTFADLTGSGKKTLERSKSPEYGARETIVQDRNGELIQTIHLPTYLLNRPVSIDEANIIRTALVAAVAAKKYGYDVKVEASLNADGIAEINSLAHYEPPKKELLSSFESQYFALPVINSLEDVKSLAQMDANQIDLPPAIVLGSQLKNSGAIGNVLELVVNTLKQKALEAGTETAKSYWRNALILASGTRQSHHLNPLLHLTEFKHYITEELPSPELGDILIPMAGRHPGTIWIRNNNLSGDGGFVTSPEHWPMTDDTDEIGNKAFNHREVVSRNKLPSPPYIVITRKGFLRILEYNGVKPEYDNLLNGNGHAPIEANFATISSSLKSIPPEIWDQATRILNRQINNCDECRLLARSNSTKEDIGGFKQYAGAFETFNSLSLSPETSSVSVLTDKPSTLAEGILAVIASMFTPELARELAGMLTPERKQALVNWAMPVKIDKQIEAVVSGVSTAQDPDTGDTDVLTVTAQLGIGGVVDGVKANRPVLTAKADRQTMQITSLIVDYADQESILLTSPEQLKHHFPPELNIDWIIAIMNATNKVQRVSGKIEIEWALDHEPGQDPHLWINQAR